MAQYIDKSALVAEIERIKEMYCYDTKTNASFVAGAVINSINNAIDAIEVKEVDLKKYYHDFLQKEWFENSHIRTVSEMMAFTAKHFFELGLFSRLTWQDIRLISEIGEDFMNSEESDNLSEEDYYQEILNRFRAQKGE